MPFDAVGSERLERDTSGGIIRANARAAKLGQISPHAQSRPQIAGNSANIGSAAAVDADVGQRPLVIQQVCCIDLHDPWLQLDRLALAGDIISAAASNLERAI